MTFKKIVHYSIVLVAIHQLLSSTPAFGLDKLVINKYDQKLLPTEGVVAQKVEFWQQIFARFKSTTAVIHDANHPEKIVDIIDHEVIAKNKNQSLVNRKKRDELNQLYLKRYNLALDRFKKLGEQAKRFGPIEQRVFNVYSRGENRLKDLYSGNITIRIQTGLADEFIAAAERAQDYFPYVEQAFREKGVPTRITRLAFVESMFNVKIESKVGASGMWQFMPSTAKLFNMHVNDLVDERNSPFIAARGAAALLAENYEALQSWPLAITAYNHGRGGMQKAIKKLKTKNLGVIVDQFESPSFGFASRNFYAEVIAAANVYDHLLNTGKIQKRPSKYNLAKVKIHHSLSMDEILKLTGMREDDMKELNSAFDESTYTHKRHAKLPRNLTLYVPSRHSKQIQLALLSKQPQVKYAIDEKKLSPKQPNSRSRSSSWN